MNFHPTPEHIVELIKRHIPTRRPISVLEPSAGEGALLTSLASIHHGSATKIVVLDIDIVKVEILKLKFPFARAINEDFLSWSAGDNRFDLVITNPPFSGRIQNWVDTDIGRRPIEVAFIEKCVKLLNDNGVLIAIVPDSIVNSIGQLRMRIGLLSLNVKYCYQLPEKTFPDIEGKFYLLVLHKLGTTREVKLRRVAESGIEELGVTFHEIEKRQYRLDYDYYSSFISKLSLDEYVSSKNGHLETFYLEKASRGSVRKEYKNASYIHTTSFQSGFWSSFSQNSLGRDEPNNYLIACKRVSRDANQTFGLIPRSMRTQCTDCLILIEPPAEKVFQTLFFLRSIFANPEGQKALLKGTGAKFIPVSSILRIKITDLSSLFQSRYQIYMDAYFSLNFHTCYTLEAEVYQKIILGGNVAFIHEGTEKKLDSPEKIAV